MNPPKLFVVVRRDLSEAQRAVQAGHALAAFLLGNPNTEWRNGALVYLTVENASGLRRLIFKLRKKSVPWFGFREPDMGHQLTAIAAVHNGKAFAKLDLL